MIRLLFRSGLLICSAIGILSANTIILAGVSQAQADFNFGFNTFTVTLTNTTPMHDAGNLLTGFVFSLNASAP